MRFQPIIGETETGGFGSDSHRARLALFGKQIAESDIVVAHTEFHLQFLSLWCGKGGKQTVGDVVDIACFRTIQLVSFIDIGSLRCLDAEVSCEIQFVGREAEQGIVDSFQPIVGHAIIGAPVAYTKAYFKFAIGTIDHGIVVSK